MQPAMLVALHRGAFATSSPSHRVRPSARASARGATITRAAGGFRVIEYGDGTTPESRGESRRRDDGFEISTDPKRLDPDAIQQFLTGSYWARGVDVQTVRRSIEGSLCFGLYQNGRQVGFARAVTDGTTFAWLADVYVIDELQGRGLGKWLVGSVVRHPSLVGLKRLMLGTRDAHGLYRQFGFEGVGDHPRFMEMRPARP